MHPTPINEAEGVFQRFFDPKRCYLDQWKFSCDEGTHGETQQSFHASTVLWRAGNGKTVARLEKDVDIDVSMYDGFIVCTTLTSSSYLTIKIIVDGTEQIPINKVQGTNTSEEFEGPLNGNRLTHVSISVVNDSADPGNGNLFWLGTFDSTRRKAMRSRPNPYNGAWEDLLVPAGNAAKITPQLDLFFGQGELEAIRNKIQSGPYEIFMNKLRKVAREELGKEPWRGVAMHPNDLRPRCYRLRGEEHISQTAMRIGSFVGLIDEDHELMRMAANHAMALCHCLTWQPEFLPNMPGSSWEQRAFYEYRWAHNAIYAWDWAGSYLTDAGKHLLAQCVSTKALPWILQSLMQHPYVRHCNQGAYFAWGAIICELALASRYPLATELLDAAIKAMDETINTYFMPDGGTDEGVGYGTSTCGHALLAYQAVARHRGQTLEEIVPPTLQKHAEYISTMISTVLPYGSAIKTADGGRAGVTVYQECLAGLHQLTGNDAMIALMSGIMAQDEFRDQPGTPGPFFNIVFGPAELPEPKALPPVFSILQDSGMLCSCRPTDEGLVRLQFIGGKERAGHSHDDRGSLVIEAFGEEIAIERGQMGYDDPRCMTIQHARYHNVLIPEIDGDLFPRQMNPCPAATIPVGKGDEARMHASMDVSAAWGEAATSCVRRVTSDEPTVFEVTDLVELPQSGRVSFNMHSKFPWKKSDKGWVTCGNKAELTVSPDWDPDEEWGKEDFIDGLKEPVYHLCLVASAAAKHKLVTMLCVQPLA